ncbi:MAG TPA: hypothetical protein VJ553_07060 [Candidatus Paceibacterota bacterium]|nr:hypothetical protein [Candidatus Paceibacterota bacterium]
MEPLTARDITQQEVARNAARKAILDAVAIFLDMGFTNRRELNLRRLWEEAGNSAVGEMSRYRGTYFRRTDSIPEDPADLTCEMS